MMKKPKEEASKKSTAPSTPKKTLLSDERIRFVAGILITGFAAYLLIACIAYLFWWKSDQSLANNILSGAEVEAKNWSGKSGHWFADLIMRNGFGFGAFFIPVIIATVGLRLLNFPNLKVWKMIFRLTFAIIIMSVLLGYIFGQAHGYLGSGPGGAHGYLISRWLNAFMGKAGTGILLSFITLTYLVLALNVSPRAFRVRLPGFLKPKQAIVPDNQATENAETADSEADNTGTDSIIGEPEETSDNFVVINKTGVDKKDDASDEESENETDLPLKPVIAGSIINDLEKPKTTVENPPENEKDLNEEAPESDTIPINITRADEIDRLSAEEVDRIMENYDPRLDLARYKFPPVSILKEHKSESAFDNAEVIENKENIIKTLADHKIPIKSIAATVGPTVTLYEVVPERGVRLAKIKSLENDIALNLSALGIRIIAPIPGRGTVGIEVPNKKPETVSMRSLITSKAYQETKADLALALGRTITNDPYIVDLTRMPHLLVAGATGQGKSVGINAIITSLLYKKHPAEVKLVLIDPKRVELPLYQKIERHFLAKLPGEEDAIITDTQKVINTLNSLCIEMDSRLELLKAAQSRNIKEYNEKFISRRLNPEKGHKYMPYIVLIIDEFADLIMTAGREIEGPIGRLAQLARAIGIHLIISTQRPSTNIITGFIKANFPTRIAFRVFSSVDSRTILDATGADRLVGRGDMLVSSGNEPVRVQCAFIDTPEIEELTEYIGSQQGYPDAMPLPEYIDDSEQGVHDIDLKKRDPMFDDAARLVVQHQQGSTSLIQRKLSIGYNRAGRIIDQLEAAGIVGSFEGSKARDVLVTDMMTLEQILNRLE
jgi:S-DNA-T family DNA segregation ATPase FtsK/SpoIIIE